MKAIKPKQDIDRPEGTLVPAHTIVEDSLWDAWLIALKSDLTAPLEEMTEIEDTDHAVFDGGGMVHQHEPDVSVTLNGCTFTCIARQVEFLLPSLRFVKNHLIGEHVSVYGRWWQIVLTKETGAKIADAFEEQAKALKNEIDRTWGILSKTTGVKAPSRDQIKKANNEAHRRANFENN